MICGRDKHDVVDVVRKILFSKDVVPINAPMLFVKQGDMRLSV